MLLEPPCSQGVLGSLLSLAQSILVEGNALQADSDRVIDLFDHRVLGTAQDRRAAAGIILGWPNSPDVGKHCNYGVTISSDQPRTSRGRGPGGAPAPAATPAVRRSGRQ